jgi:hypothetical protein
MERLVLLYTVGDGCTYSCDEVVPITYESKESAILDFGSKILEVEQIQETYHTQSSQWQNRLNSLSSPEKKSEHFKSRPQSPKDSFEFAGKTFFTSSFYSSEYNQKTQETDRVFNEPTSLTLDEWYQS